MIKFSYAFADIISKPLSFSILTTLAFVGSAIALLTGENIDAATIVNLAISVTTIIIGQAVLVSGLARRRARMRGDGLRRPLLQNLHQPSCGSHVEVRASTP